MTKSYQNIIEKMNFTKEELIIENIKNIILKKNEWMEVQEVAETFGVERSQQLFDNGHNSTVAQLINRFLKKQGFKTEKVLFDDEGYCIWVSAPDVPEDTLKNILENKYDCSYTIAEKARKIKVKPAPVIEEIEYDQDQDNEALNKIIGLINKGENIFITGYAGTGKSYILNKLKKRFKIDVTSTTGLAAVNIQGQTIHAWSGVGICNKPVQLVADNIRKRSKLKKQVLKCEILAIDEISMLDARTFDYIDTVLRIARDIDEPFGGIQVLLFGDFFQLPPVEKDERGFCFQSRCWRDLNLKTVFLEKIYRQTDDRFIRALNNIRMNSITEDDLQLFRGREVRYNTYNSDILHIFSTNKEADTYNSLKFNAISSPVHRFISEDKIHKKKGTIDANEINSHKSLSKFDLISLEAFDKYCKAPQVLELKVGCKVMLLKNHNFAKGLINGSCGVVQKIEEDGILVKFDNNIEEIIPKNTFEYHREGELVCSRDQYPLRLAYGITIHKSQGMTLDELVVDCNRIFECGQAYVALSRIKSIDGLYLRSFNPSKVVVNEEVINFYDSLRNRV